MPIRNDTELKSAIDTIDRNIQEVQDYLGQGPHPEGKVRFPRGFIRTADHFRARLWFLNDQNVKDNLAYALILSDVYRWLTNRTDLFGTAREMVIKAGIVLAGSICETIAVEYTNGVIGRKHKFKVRCERMVAAGMTNTGTADELKWLWDTRTSIHIYEVSDREYEKYKIADYNRAIKALRALRDELDAHKSAEIRF